MKSLTPILLILISIGIFFFFIDPRYKETQTLLAEKNKNDIAIEKATQLRKERSVLQERYNNISDSEREILSQILPDTVDNVRLILDMNNIANDYGIVLKGINVSGGPISETSEVNRSPNSNNSGQLYGTIQLSFSVTASYDVFKTFMKDLQDSLRLVDITDFTVTAGEGDLYNYSLTLNTYWLR